MRALRLFSHYTAAAVVPLAMAQRGIGSRNPHDSNATPRASRHFDVEDVDADRLTHFYWDGEELSPYELMHLMEAMDEGDEWVGEVIYSVDPRDRPLLESEYYGQQQQQQKPGNQP